LEERYESRDTYLTLVRAETERLVTDRYLLAEDVDLVIQACANRYDAAVTSGGVTAISN
jgi:hypothetical protein